VPSFESAAAEMRADRPDLVLVSAVLPPRAEDQVVTLLKELDPDGMVPVLTIPPIVESGDDVGSRRRLFSMLARKRPQGPKLPYDPDALLSRIGETLAHVRQMKNTPRLRLAPKPAASTELVVYQGDLQTRPALAVVGKPEPTSLMLSRRRTHRAHRLPPDALPWRCTLTTPAGLIVRMINVSSTGVLFESPLKFAPDSELSLGLLSPQAKLDLPARIVRSEVSAVNGLGVTYQTAATFGENIELINALSGSASDSTASGQGLAELLMRVTNELYVNQSYDDARSAFEHGLRQMVPACDIRLRDELSDDGNGGDSIYFTVPGPKRAVLQATFDPGHEPTPDEFKVLRGAAAVATVLLQHQQTAAIARSA
jgi:hypothetical protein